MSWLALRLKLLWVLAWCHHHHDLLVAELGHGATRHRLHRESSLIRSTLWVDHARRHGHSLLRPRLWRHHVLLVEAHGLLLLVLRWHVVMVLRSPLVRWHLTTPLVHGRLLEHLRILPGRGYHEALLRHHLRCSGATLHGSAWWSLAHGLLWLLLLLRRLPWSSHGLASHVLCNGWKLACWIWLTQDFTVGCSLCLWPGWVKVA